MGSIRLIVAMFILTKLPAPASAQAEEQARWPQRPDELAVSLSVREALEDGPVVCTVTLKNVSKVELNYATSMFEKGAFCAVDADWKARKEPLMRRGLICGNIGPYEQRLYPGQTASETFYLHKGFLSVPAGKVAIHFGWRVYRIVEKPDEKDLDRRQLDLLFELKDTQTVEVLPATEKNVAATLQRLEAELPAAAKVEEAWPEHVWAGPEPSRQFVGTVDGCRHQELVPLLAARHRPAAHRELQTAADRCRLRVLGLPCGSLYRVGRSHRGRLSGGR